MPDVKIQMLPTRCDGDHMIQIAALCPEEGFVGYGRILDSRPAEGSGGGSGGERVPVLQDVYVLPQRRGEGIGRAITQAATRWAEGQDKALWLHVAHGNDFAQMLYQGEGFTYAEPPERAVGPREGVRWMRDPGG